MIINEIPIIEVVSGKGYWEVYSDRKIWHSEGDWKNMGWNNTEEINKKYNIGGGFMTLLEGDNPVRFVSDFVDFGSHYNPKTNKSLICLGKDNCEACQAGEKPSVKFLVFVIDRKDKKLKPFTYGHTIYKQIKAWRANPEYEFEVIPDYDMTINRVGVGKASVYTVMPARKNTELTNDEKVLIEEEMKDPAEIVASMKAKVSGSPVEKVEGLEDQEEVNVEDIPF